MTTTAARLQARRPRAALRWVSRLLALGLVTAVVGALTVVIVLPRATHGSALTVLTGSMTPGIPVGSVVMVRPVDPGTLHVGDVATYQKEPGKAEYITHRIVKIDASVRPTRFTFKGDANRGADIDPVSAKQIRGKVWFHVPYLGAIRDGLHGKGGLSLVAMLLLGGYALSQLSGAFGERRKDRPTTSRVDRTVVLAELSTEHTARTRGLTPDEVAAQWRAVLLGQDASSFRLLIVPPPHGLAATVELLLDLGAREITVHEPPVTMTGPGRRIRPAATDKRGSDTTEGADRAGT